MRCRWALLVHARALLTREVHSEKTLKENAKEISIFISSVSPCTQLSYRYISTHLDTFPMHRKQNRKILILRVVVRKWCVSAALHVSINLNQPRTPPNGHPWTLDRGFRPFPPNTLVSWVETSSWFDRPFGINTRVGGTVLHSSRY
jgi:hypothetical protein